MVAIIQPTKNCPFEEAQHQHYNLHLNSLGLSMPCSAAPAPVVSNQITLERTMEFSSPSTYGYLPHLVGGFLDFLSTKPSAAPMRRRRRRVHFVDDANNTTAFIHRSEDDLKNTWYTESEILVFKEQVKQQVFQLRRRNKTSNVDHKRSKSNESCLRGLENYTNERLSHRHTMVRNTVQSYKENGVNGCNVAAQTAIKFSSWSEEIAFLQGCKDYCDVYYPNMSNMIDVTDVNNNEATFAAAATEATSSTPSDCSRTNNKRQRSSSQEENDEKYEMGECHERNAQRRRVSL